MSNPCLIERINVSSTLYLLLHFLMLQLFIIISIVAITCHKIQCTFTRQNMLLDCLRSFLSKWNLSFQTSCLSLDESIISSITVQSITSSITIQSISPSITIQSIIPSITNQSIDLLVWSCREKIVILLNSPTKFENVSINHLNFKLYNFF